MQHTYIQVYTNTDSMEQSLTDDYILRQNRNLLNYLYHVIGPCDLQKRIGCIPVAVLVIRYTPDSNGIQSGASSHCSRKVACAGGVVTSQRMLRTKATSTILPGLFRTGVWNTPIDSCWTREAIQTWQNKPTQSFLKPLNSWTFMTQKQSRNRVGFNLTGIIMSLLLSYIY